MITLAVLACALMLAGICKLSISLAHVADLHAAVQADMLLSAKQRHTEAVLNGDDF